MGYAREHGLPKVYVLIDEYDNFTNQLLTAYKDLLYEQVTTKDSFLRTFFKVIKAGIGERSIRTCFCTGVLPVTMDDLTSGYNIAEILTLEPEFLSMLGFTYKEAEVYLRYVLDTYTEGQDRFDDVWQLIVNNYDGYRFLPEAEPLFNSTILTYFFKKFAVRKGGIPSELVDENLRTDIGWIRRLTLSLENAKEMLDALVIDDELSYNVSDLSSKFNKRKFFDKSIYPVSLFYLGMTTLRSIYRMVLPNLTMRSIYMDYYNEMNHIEGNAQRYVPTYERFTEERRFEPLVQSIAEDPEQRHLLTLLLDDCYQKSLNPTAFLPAGTPRKESEGAARPPKPHTGGGRRGPRENGPRREGGRREGQPFSKEGKREGGRGFKGRKRSSDKPSD